MDDILSAVDSQVARHLVDTLLCDHLSNKTRILCTHHAYYLQSADWILVFDNGRIVSQGKLVCYIFHFGFTLSYIYTRLVSFILLRNTSVSVTVAGIFLGTPSETLLRYADIEIGSKEKKKLKTACCSDDERESAIPSCEERNTGELQFEVIVSYWKAVGIYLAPAILAALLLMQSSKNVSDWWLAHWVSELQNGTKAADETLLDRLLDSATKNSSYFLGVYGAIAGANTIFTFLRAFLFARGGLNAAKFMHSRLVDVVLQVNSL